MSDAIDSARKLIQARLQELEEEAKNLQKALQNLGEKSPTKRGGRSPRKRAGRPKSSKRAPRGQRREQLLAAIKANPGARPADLAKAIGIKSTQVHALIAKARADKLIVKRGKGYALNTKTAG